jgi:hypothetical protein
MNGHDMFLLKQYGYEVVEFESQVWSRDPATGIMRTDEKIIFPPQPHSDPDAAHEIKIHLIGDSRPIVLGGLDHNGYVHDRVAGHPGRWVELLRKMPVGAPYLYQINGDLCGGTADTTLFHTPVCGYCLPALITLWRDGSKRLAAWS